MKIHNCAGITNLLRAFIGQSLFVFWNEFPLNKTNFMALSVECPYEG